jgi:hypothetical protein
MQTGIAAAWQRFWFQEIAPHSYALLRILFGSLAAASLIGLRDLSVFWSPHGLVPAHDAGLGLKSFLLSHGWGDAGAVVLFTGSLVAYVSLAIGFQSDVAVPASLTASVVQVLWNRLPLSGAHAVVQVVLFFLVWTDCGAVWSIDAWRRRGQRASRQGLGSSSVIAPLRLIRLQVALIYLSSGLWKLPDPHWRDGSAVHYVLNNNLYRRFPGSLPPSLDNVATLLTYGILAWELSFAFLILSARTRRIALLAGVLVHLGFLATIEIGPFSWVMLASYVAFLDPMRVAALPEMMRLRFAPRSASDKR